MVASYMPTGEVPGLGKLSGTAVSFTDFLLGFVLAASNVLAGKTAMGQAAATVATAQADLGASTTAAASLRIRSGVAPTAPNDGDIWFDGTNIFMRVGGVTKTFTLI